MTRSRIASLLALLVFSLLVGGCPDPSPGPSTPTPAPSASASASPTQLDPLEGRLFSKEELFALYEAQMADEGDAEARALREKHRLIDAGGKPVKARQEAFQRALKTYAERDPEGWSEFVQSISKR